MIYLSSVDAYFVIYLSSIDAYFVIYLSSVSANFVIYLSSVGAYFVICLSSVSAYLGNNIWLITLLISCVSETVTANPVKSELSAFKTDLMVHKTSINVQ